MSFNERLAKMRRSSVYCRALWGIRLQAVGLLVIVGAILAGPTDSAIGFPLAMVSGLVLWIAGFILAASGTRALNSHVSGALRTSSARTSDSGRLVVALLADVVARPCRGEADQSKVQGSTRRTSGQSLEVDSHAIFYKQMVWATRLAWPFSLLAGALLAYQQASTGNGLVLGVLIVSASGSVIGVLWFLYHEPELDRIAERDARVQQVGVSEMKGKYRREIHKDAFLPTRWRRDHGKKDW